MLQLKSIRKAYTTGSLTQVALDKVTLNLRDSEFVAVLGPSGSGKTTLLNIIGGLDRYDTGDLVIDGVSTTRYKDRDWDSYRNHAVGFVFQNYNLIPHQSVLANVELALTISGIPKAERRRRALAALDQVGLGDQAHKRPNQMSGGQMQRVAIARALVNDPSVLLADEPTGALDSTTSTGVMDLLKQVAQDRLVIMVTHNAELAQRYATRLVKLRDGAITEDTDPFDLDDAAHPTPQHKNMGKASMSFVTALSLSFKNLLTKKTRTMLTSFAGSIGIIGIALILSLSSGMQAYIQSIQEDTLSTYPIEITAEALDISGMMTAMMADNTTDRTGRDPDTVYSNNIITDLMESMSGQLDSNDLAQFKKFLESPDGQAIADLSNTIQYGYDLDLQIYGADTTDGVLKVNPTEIFTEVLGVGSSGSQGGATGPGGVGVQMSSSGLPGASSNPMAVVRSDIWSEMLGNEELLRKQYDVLAGSWPQTYDEVVIVLDENNELSDVALYSLGILEQDHLAKMMEQIQNGETVEPSGIATLSYQDLLDLRFKLVLNTDVYAKEGSVWVDQSDSQVFMKPVVTNALEVKVVGVLRPNAEITAASISGTVAYTQALNQYVMEQIAASAIVHEQTADPSVNVLTGAPFDIDA
ncbi:MAG: ABC transporter ATP-binding protein, partial [Bifidobacteriaceae bacterium]|nr:ABC transporter ATP-binding protein [Bifidobacteriaceae bacterium]